MSHTYTAELPVLKDMSLLRQAFTALGWTIQESAVARTWYANPDRTKVYPLVAVNPLHDGYDVGLVPQSDKIKLEADLFAPGHIVEQLGKDYGRLIMHYNLAYAKQQAVRKGYKVKVVDKDGDLHVEVTQ